MTTEQISCFLDTAIRNRLAVRLLAEQHIAISRDLQYPERASKNQIGVVELNCSPKKMIGMVGSFVSDLCEATLGASPQIIIDGEADATFAYVPATPAKPRAHPPHSYIPVHLEYILTEILKNSFRASVERHHRTHGSGSRTPIPPVQLTIAPPPASAQGSAVLCLRIRDQGGGVPPANIPHIFSYSFTTARADDADELGGGPYAAQHVGGSAAVGGSGGSGEPGGSSLFGEIVGRGVQTGMGTIAGLGYGLPMSRLYAM